MAVSIGEYEKALGALTEAVEIYNHTQNEALKKLVRDGAIQRFEFCVELAWKTSLKVLGLQNMPPKPSLREMAQGGLIDDFKLWSDFLEARNKTSHTYDDEVAAEVFASVLRFLPEGQKLLRALSAK